MSCDALGHPIPDDLVKPELLDAYEIVRRIAIHEGRQSIWAAVEMPVLVTFATTYPDKTVELHRVVVQGARAADKLCGAWARMRVSKGKPIGAMAHIRVGVVEGE